MHEYNGFVIKGDGTFGLKVVSRKGAGNTPVSLKGSFTNTANAMKEIDRYLEEKGSKNGKAGSSSGD